MISYLLFASVHKLSKLEGSSVRTHRFNKGKSCLTKLVAFYDGITASEDKGRITLSTLLVQSIWYCPAQHLGSQSGEKWIWWMDCFLDKELAEWSNSESCGQQLSVQRETNDEWCSSWIIAWTDAIQHHCNIIDSGIKFTLSSIADDRKLSGALKC